MDTRKEPLLGKTTVALEEIRRSLDLPAFTPAQISGWIYRKEVQSISEMTNLSRRTRSLLEDSYCIGVTEPVEVLDSSDGTRKYLFAVGERCYVEAAYIPESSRATLCVSTQAGCARGCRFCMTGLQGLQRNLSAGEILNQYAAIPEKPRITNIVYMGMGEPLDNLEPVLESLEIFNSKTGYGLSPRRITVSTVGIWPQFERLYDAADCNIAVSLHSPWSEERSRIMPVETQHPVRRIIEFLKERHARERRGGNQARSRRRISFEYILFDRFNDGIAHAKELVRLLHGIRCRVNLIRFNPGEDSFFRPATIDATLAFQETLKAKGMIATIRKSRGEDIHAACGLLSTRRLL